MTRNPTLLIATSNEGKLREATSLLEDLSVTLVTLADFPGLPGVIEDGRTFAENARKKAEHYARFTGSLTLADDSGLEVDALGGAPGVHSARFAGIPGDDAANNAKLLAALNGVPPQRRSARFRCVIALADSERVIAIARGSIEGVILDQPRGQNGFGYDPFFYVPELGLTAAEMPPELKNRVSHRGRAITEIRPHVKNALKPGTR